MKRRLVLTVKPEELNIGRPLPPRTANQAPLIGLAVKVLQPEELNSGRPLPPRTENQARLLGLADKVLADNIEKHAAEGEPRSLRRENGATHKKAA